MHISLGGYFIHGMYTLRRGGGGEIIAIISDNLKTINSIIILGYVIYSLGKWICAKRYFVLQIIYR